MKFGLGGPFFAAWIVCACGAPRQHISTDGGVGATGQDAVASVEPGDTGAETSGDGEESGAPPILDVGGPETPPPPAFPTTCAEAFAGESSVGCRFYPLSLPQNWQDTREGGSCDRDVGGEPLGDRCSLIAATNVSMAPATVTLRDANGVVEEQVVAPGEVGHFSTRGAHLLDGETDRSRAGLRLDSDQPLQVFHIAPPFPRPTADASIVLPSQALGTQHRVISYHDGNQFGGQYLAVAATEDDTQVTIRTANPRTYLGGSADVDPVDPEVGPNTVTLTLNTFDALTVGAPDLHPTRGITDNELTGTTVEANKPIAVYSGTGITFVPAPPDPDRPGCCGDLMATAVPPTRVFGKRYVAAKLLPLGDAPDLWRFVAHEDGTEIVLRDGVDDLFTLDAGEFRDVLATEAFIAEGTNAFALAQFMTGQDHTGITTLETHDCGPLNGPGDPAFEWVYPVDNWLSRYLFPVGPALETTVGPWCHDHATVVSAIDTWGELRLNGEALPDALAIGASGFGYVHLPLRADWYELTGPIDTRAQLTVYGYTAFGSYTYPGGMGIRTLNPAG